MFKFLSKLYQCCERPAFMRMVENTTLFDDYICGVLKIPPDIIENFRKEGNMANELIELYAQRKAELEAEKLAKENADVEALVNAKFEEVKDEIRAEVLKVHYAEIDDISLEIKAIERLIAREEAKVELVEEKLDEQEVPEGVEA